MAETHVIGVDVGGTNTDAAIVRYPGRDVIHSVKVPTTKDFSSGIILALQDVLKGQSLDISGVMVGTTTFLNAVLQCSSDLSRVVVLRICGPTSIGYPPFINFPKQLKEALETEWLFLKGGYEFDGRPVEDIDPGEVQKCAHGLAKKYADQEAPLSIAVSGVFSPMFHEQEDRACQIIEETFAKNNFTNYYITKSNAISGLGLLEREGATILNAALRPLAVSKIQNFQANLAKLNLTCDAYLTQNDGTLISFEEAMKFPIFTFCSGPTNSTRGAFQLSGIENAIIADIGGTSTDIAVLQNGFPRYASSYVDVAGVRTTFRMPDTVSIGLGGGSLVRFKDGRATVGPQSVGYKITKEAKCFGGDILVATDVAMKLGIASIEGADVGRVDLDSDKASAANDVIVKMLAKVVDKMKTTKDEVPLILVGGGSVLIPENVKIPGISKVVKPGHFGVANAIGATIAKMSAEAHDVIDFAAEGHEEKLANVKDRASQKALDLGAVSGTVEIFTDLIHCSYMPGRCMKVICRAVGDIDLLKGKRCNSGSIVNIIDSAAAPEPYKEDVSTKESDYSDVELPVPNIEMNKGRKEWLLTEMDIHCMAIGAGILGTGGGGSPYLGTLEALVQLRKGLSMRIVACESISPKEYVLGAGYFGAPLVMREKLGGPMKHVRASKTVERYRGLLEPTTKLGAIAAIKIGGYGSLVPLYVGAERRLPIVDCDFMGRSFPGIPTATPIIYGENPCPMALADEKGNELMMTSVQKNSGLAMEEFLREAGVRMGCDSAVCGLAVQKDNLLRFGILNSYSKIWKLGRDILEARKKKTDPLLVIEQTQGGKRIFTGKIVDVIRATEGGYDRGSMVIDGLGPFAGSKLHIDMKNVNLIAKLEKDGKKEVVATVPDLISLVDVDSYQPILNASVRYGLRVSVLAMPAHPLMTAHRALMKVEPKVFGYPDVKYTPCGTYVKPFSVFTDTVSSE